jgi:hypothetical protein
LAKREANKKADEAKDRALREATNWQETVVGGDEATLLPTRDTDVDARQQKLEEQVCA